MPDLPKIKDCTGCAACVDACPHQAITLTEDSNGFFRPAIDPTLCVECKLCEKKCHILQQDKLHRADPKDIETFAGWSTNEEIIKNSASGGIFGQLAWNFLGEPNTYVYGATLTDDNSVRHVEISDRKDLIGLQNSKYQQDNPTGIYRLVAKRLKEGSRVLFSGLPCHIAALKVYLGKLADDENLFTVEVICHGVPTNQLSRVALKLNGAKKILTYRHKHKGWGPSGNHVVYMMRDEKEETETEHFKDFLFRSYLNMNLLRESCSNCRYANLHRVADLTIGDFWGLERSKRYAEYRNPMGTSVILANTPKGKAMLANAADLHYVDCAWEDFLEQNHNLYQAQQPSVYHTGRYIKYIKHLPVKMQRVILQHGFVNLTLNKWYWRIWKLFRYNYMKKAPIAQKRFYQEAINSTKK